MLTMAIKLGRIPDQNSCSFPQELCKGTLIPEDQIRSDRNGLVSERIANL